MTKKQPAEVRMESKCQPRRACAAVRPRRPCGKVQRVHNGVRKAGYLGDVGLIITKIGAGISIGSGRVAG